MGFSNSTSPDVWRMNPDGSLMNFNSSSSSSSRSTAPEAFPSYFPGEDTGRLIDQYDQARDNFSSADYDKSSLAQQSRAIATATNMGNAAAAAYSNRARQAGGSGMGAELVKSQAITAARGQAGELELKRQEFDASQREKYAKESIGIASTLATMRMDYLKTLANFSAQRDQASIQREQLEIERGKLDLAREAEGKKLDLSKSGGYGIDSLGRVSGHYGNALQGNPWFNQSTGILTHGGGR